MFNAWFAKRKIANVFSVFSKMIDSLEEGVALAKAAHAENQAKIDALKKTNAEYGEMIGSTVDLQKKILSVIH